MRKSLKRTLGLGILGGVAFAAWRTWNAQAAQRPRGPEWTTAPFPFPPAPRPAGDRAAPAPVEAPTPDSAPSAASATWAEPNEDGSCPEGHPVKAKLASGIYHLPGGANYARTHADRCYVDEAAAEADGLRPSKV